ncbi:metallophosphoesterase family protein [Dactylosporangium aurantiacum]|uniref:Metallophosphoesterase family protein n=1 Tax=Dactylosporangium aurantiacum TaxID=35754 RepID=A0A9Q9ID28_9ACTN|nr:metallophosphoesterase family protein [Dactylosporangium aurantiacum]MDG6102142.1 metallophosphoesterase family protein [Dactylosporangium aurantiacum]UWZ53536.1 metallophosphoesterase family protein [Dactylosporangium aurantiacum]
MTVRGSVLRIGEPVERLAVLSDVHANVPALEAVLAEPDVHAADLVLFCGDLTWGPEPVRTVELVRALGPRAVFVRGNADRAVLELAAGDRAAATPREAWMLARHPVDAVAFLAGFHFGVVVEVAGLGPVRCCHGSPRADTELVTPATPAARMAALSAGVPERILVGGHTHLQFDRTVGGLRSVNPGSVGLPYHDGAPGTAYWALLGPDVSLRRSRYDVRLALAATADAGDPKADTITDLLTSPPSVAGLTAHAEGLEFSD